MRRWMVVCVLAVAASVSHAQAVSRTFLWDAPTQNTDGTPAVVDGYTVYRSVDNGVTFSKLGSTAALITTFTDPSVPAGQLCYQVTDFNLLGESAASNRVCFQVPTAKGKPPGNLR